MKITSNWTVPYLSIIVMQHEGPEAPWLMSILVCLN